MTMCMYLRRVSDRDAARYRRDSDAVMAATVGAQFGGHGLPGDVDGLFNDANFDDMFGRPTGLFGWLKAWLIKRALKAAIRKQVAQLKKASVAMSTPPGGGGAADIPSPDAMVDLHKSWQVLHFVLTGTPDSGPARLNVLLLGGEEVGEDLGYGPARLIDPQTMADFARALRAFDLDEVLRRLDVPRMAASGVYCIHEDDDPEAQLIELEEDMRLYLPALQAFADKAASARQGALIWLS